MGVKHLDKILDYLYLTHDTQKLEKHLESSGAEFRVSSLSDALGLTEKDLIHIDMSKFGDGDFKKSKDVLFFVLLHEVCHFKRIKKFGWDLDKFLPKLSESEYIDFIINEELIADRYGRLFFYIYNKYKLPITETQQLHKVINKEYYARRLKFFYAYIKDNPSAKYSELIKTYIND